MQEVRLRYRGEPAYPLGHHLHEVCVRGMRAPKTIHCPGLRFFVKEAAARLDYDTLPWPAKMMFWLSVPIAFRQWSANFPIQVKFTNLRGHPIYSDGEQFRYQSDDTPTVGGRRQCGSCGKRDTPEGHDACLGTLPGVRNACCGHGVESEAYIQWPDGSCINGVEAVQVQHRLREHKQ